MITNKTLFILGAGSNREYDFPLATDLRDAICREPWISSVFTLSHQSYDVAHCRPREYTDFCYAYRESDLYSIDKFLSFRPEFARIGKLAIILHILQAEKNSELFHMPCFKQTWYRFLLDRILEDVHKNEVEKLRDNRISFITFNYDRSLEYFLYRNLKNLFDPEDKLSYKEIVPFEILHVYGSIAPLPEENPAEGIAFGDIINLPKNVFPDMEKIREALERLSIISDERESDRRIHALISEAQQIFFLGFGFDKDNMTILGIPGICSPNQRVYATVYGMHDREIERVGRMLGSGEQTPVALLGNKFNFRIKSENRSKINCLALLKQYL